MATGKDQTTMGYSENLIKFAHKHLRRLDKHLHGLAGVDTVDAVHDFRVASRRLQEPLAIMAHWQGRKTIKRHQKGLKRLRRALRVVRDIDVLRLSFQNETTRPRLEAGDAQHLHDLLRIIRTEEFTNGLAKLNDHQPPRVIAALEAGVDDFARQAGDEDEAVYALAQQQWRDHAERVLAHQLVDDPSADLHLCRVHIKHFRYSTELLRQMQNAEKGELIAALTAMQDALGAWNDHQFASVRLAALATDEEQLARRAHWSAAVLRAAADRADQAHAMRQTALRNWPRLSKAIDTALTGTMPTSNPADGADEIAATSAAKLTEAIDAATKGSHD